MKCPRCMMEQPILTMTFRCSRGPFAGRILCQGCFRYEEYGESHRNPYGSKGTDRIGTAQGPHL